MAVADAASLLGCTSATVSRMLAAYKIDTRNEVAAEDWELSEDAKASLENFLTSDKDISEPNLERSMTLRLFILTG